MVSSSRLTIYRPDCGSVQRERTAGSGQESPCIIHRPCWYTAAIEQTTNAACDNALSVAKNAGRVATNAGTWLVDGILDSVVTERHLVEVGRAGPFVIAADANQPEVLYKPVEHIFDVHLFLPPTVRPTCGASTDT